MEAGQDRIYNAYVVNEVEGFFMLITDYDYNINIIEKVNGEVPVGEFTLPNSDIKVNICDVKITRKKLLSACKEYVYDIKRKRDYSKKRREQKKSDVSKVNELDKSDSDNVNYVV